MFLLINTLMLYYQNIFSDNLSSVWGYLLKYAHAIHGDTENYDIWNLFIVR